MTGVTAPPLRPTVFLECTHTYHSDLNTGIQRVVRNILRNISSVADRYGYDLVPVIFEEDRFVFADAGRVLADKQREAPPTKESLPKSGGRVARLLRLLRPKRRGAATLDEIGSCQGSILLLLDSSWPYELWPAVARFKQCGGKVVGVIYDLIPLTHAATYPTELVVSFSAWLRGHVRTSDALVCISRSVANQLSEFVRSNPATADRRVPIGHFHLGSELDLVRVGEVGRPAVEAIFAGDRHVFLMVGSIEPRKNHAYVLDAFEALWRAGGAATLVIVGRNAWKTEQLIDRIERHEQYGRQLFVLRDASDADLNHAYRNASALVLASEVEGFGLPIVEAFQYGLPVLCSDIPVFREIADGRATFFKLGDPRNLTATLESYCRTHDPTARTERHPQGWITWRESTEQLFAAVMRIGDGSTPVPETRKVHHPT
jgi:glycosyltransferase involved in cell wall biosynthesis